MTTELETFVRRRGFEMDNTNNRCDAEHKILACNAKFFQAIIDGKEVEYKLSPDFDWECFVFDHNTLDLLSRCEFRFKSNDA